MSTVSTEGASFSMALASAMVRLGRRISVAKSAPELRLTPLILATKIVLGPSDRIRSRSDSSNPRMSDVMPTIDVIPMTTPRIVRPERILLPRNVSSAMRQTSPIRPLFTAQCLDGIEPGGAGGWIRSKEQADAGGNADAEHDGPELQRRRQRRESRDGLCRQESEADADQPAECRQRDRFRQYLRHDVAPLGA